MINKKIFFFLFLPGRIIKEQLRELEAAIANIKAAMVVILGG